MSARVDSAIRLTVVMTHPVQYYAPWFRHIAERCPAIDLTVLYATQPTREQQGVGFGRAFQWDVPLTEGYRCRVLRPARAGESVHSDSFRGLDVPEIGPAQVGLTKIDLDETCSTQVSVAKIGSAKVCSVNLYSAQIGSAQVGRTEISSGESGISEVGSAQIGASEIGSIEVR